MNHQLLNRLLFVFCCFLTISLNAQIIGIEGPIKPCKKKWAEYSVASPVIGATYNWSVDSGTAISNTYGISTQIFLDGQSSVTIQVEGKDASGNTIGTGSKEIIVIPLPTPRIRTNVRVGCERLDQPGPEYTGQLFELEEGSCTKVCENSLVQYYAGGKKSSIYTWNVTGGTIVGPSSGPTITVNWGTVGSGTISVTETDINGCQGSSTYCVTIIPKPIAQFSTIPEPDRRDEELTVCLNQPINFIDGSTQGTGSEIKNWHWDFGDNTSYSSSTTANPVHSYGTPGYYGVVLTVKNACNCTSSYSIRVRVLAEQGVTITCASIVCEGNQATYSVEGLPCEITEDATRVAWSVVGGSISSYSGNTVVVKWDDHPNLESGFGYVSFDPAFCREIKCPKITTIKIPVILKEATINGNKNICIGRSYIYRLPAWPGTAFTWTINGSSSGPITPVFTDQPNEVVITPTQNETIIIDCSYHTDLTSCDGTARFEAIVGAAVFIDGTQTVCQSGTASFNLAGSPSGNWRWVVRNPLGVYNYYNNPPYNTLNLTGLIPGTYTIDVDQCSDFCPPVSFILKVDPSPTIPAAIAGPTEVCPNNIYEYTASSTQAGYEFIWEIISGAASFQGSNIGQTISVKFTGGGPWQLGVKRLNMAQPDCPSESRIKTINQFSVPSNIITGDLSACPNTRKNYACTYANAEDYRWSISPTTAGSVESGDGTPNISILWNNNSSGLTKTLTLKVRKCGIEYIRTYNVDVTLSPSISLSYTTPVCRGMFVPITLNISPSVTSPIVNWDFGNGSTIANGGTLQTISYVDAISAPASYSVSATLTGYAGCTNIVPIIATGSVNVNPAPMVKLTPATSYTHCGYPFSIPIEATLTTGYGSTSQLLWSTPTGNTTCTSPFTGCNPIAATVDGYYSVQASNSYGCTYQSQVIGISENCTPLCGFTPPASTVTLNSYSCGLASVSSVPGGTFSSYNWTIAPALGVSVIAQSSTSWQANISQVGHYKLAYQATYTVGSETCSSNDLIDIDMPIEPKLEHAISCGTASNYDVLVSNKSVILSGTVINYIVFNVYNAAGTSLLYTYTEYPSTFSHNFALLAGTGYQLEVAVNYTYGSTTETCTSGRTSITLPNKPVASFTVDADGRCVGEAVFFNSNASTPVLGAGITYAWSFGDVATVLDKNPVRVYNTSGNYQPTLTITDAHGCSSIAYAPTPTQSIDISVNNLNGTGNILPSSLTTICEGANQLLQFNNTGAGVPVFYTWMNDNTAIYSSTSNYITVSNTGNYWVKLEDAYRCKAKTDAVNIAVCRVAQPSIVGPSSICEGKPFTLNGYVGSTGGSNPVQYTWYRNNSQLIGYYSYTLDQSGLGVGSYDYYVVASVNNPSTGIPCSRNSAHFTVIINAQPSPPIIQPVTLLDCNNYQLQLTATNSISGFYHWSNGAYGSSISTSVGGFYKVWFTTVEGCGSSAETQVDKDPKGYLWVMPEGCYEDCPKSPTGFTVNGPIIPFHYWEWNLNSYPYSNGYNSLPQSLNILAPATYGLLLQNSYGCTASTSNLHFSVTDGCFNSFQCPEFAWYNVTGIEPGEPCKFNLDFYLYNIGNDPLAYTITPDIGSLATSGGIMAGNSLTTLSSTFYPPNPAGSVKFHLRAWLPNGEVCETEYNFEYNCEGSRAVFAASDKKGPRLIPQSSVTFKVWPNPVTAGPAKISYILPEQEAQTGTTLEIYSMLGRMVQQQQLKGKEGSTYFDASKFAPGTYLLQLRGKTGKILANSKLVIAR